MGVLLYIMITHYADILLTLSSYTWAYMTLMVHNTTPVSAQYTYSEIDSTEK